MTLEKIKRNIAEKLKGKKVAEKDLFGFIVNAYGIEKDWSPTKFLFNFTELEMPDKCYDSVYYIPTKKSDREDIQAPYVKEVLVFLGTEDGKRADYICTVYPFNVSIETMDYIYNSLRQII